MIRGKVIGDSRILKRGMVTIPVKVREKLQVKEGDFLVYTETRNGNIIVKKAVFDIDETVKQIEQLRKKGLLLIDKKVDIRKSFENFMDSFSDKND
ncbi:MAG TPA: AbrB/MazE/SpoVT family DNA-binding domain-containing protein [Candidatus Nitrosocosmicus sp.]|nr:AbrB/MazE/SpoVT family DNA-binding domain-containing protein [Candidatus Nitrosocosmicus sp.]